MAIIEFKQRVAGACIHGIIISKLNHEQKLGLIILLKVNKGLKICFYYAILPFYLTVDL